MHRTSPCVFGHHAPLCPRAQQLASRRESVPRMQARSRTAHAWLSLVWLAVNFLFANATKPTTDTNGLGPAPDASGASPKLLYVWEYGMGACFPVLEHLSVPQRCSELLY